MSEALAPLVLGFALGLQHAADADHVVAVATIVSRTRRLGAGVLVGAFWALGHTLMLAAVGLAVLLLGARIAPELAAWGEGAVALMLVALGGLRLAWLFRGADPVPAAHVVEPHEHGGVEAFHSHPHAHGGRVHRHPHVHPSGPLLAALESVGTAQALRSVGVGLVHGLGGSAPVVLLGLATVPGPAAALAYLGAFGAGTAAGMGAVTGLLAAPWALGGGRLEPWRRVVGAGSGALCVALGVYLGVQAGAAQGLWGGPPRP